MKNIPLAAKLSAHEKRWRERNWRQFSRIAPGRLSWANWFYMQSIFKMGEGAK